MKPFEIIVYHIWKKEMHPEWQCYFDKGEQLLTEIQNGQFSETDFIDFFRDRGLQLSINEEKAEGRLLRLLVSRLLIVYCNRCWDIEMEVEHADECLKKLCNAEYIKTIIRCWLLNRHCQKYFPALGWITEPEMEKELENHRTTARSRIFRTHHFIQPINMAAQSIAPLPPDQKFQGR